jgi:transposase
LKDDRKDPAVIATVMELGKTLTVVVPAGVAADLRAVVRARAAVQHVRLAECHRLTSLLSQVFPEFLKVMHGVTSQTAQYLLAHYPTPAALLTAERTVVEAEVRRVSRGRLGTARVAALVAAAQETIGVPTGLEGASVAIRGGVERLGLYGRQLTELEDRLAQLLEQVPEVAVLFSLKGIGVITVATVVGEVGSLPAFPSQAALFKYVGLNLYERSSGQWKGQRRISKHGSRLVRHALFLAAVNMIRTNGLFHAYAQRQQARGKPAKVILTAVMRKILARMYAMVRDQQVFQPRTAYSQAA